MKICPEDADLFNAHVQTDRHYEANSRFRNSVNAPKNYAYLQTEILLKYRQITNLFFLKFEVLSRSNIVFWDMTP